MFSDEAPTTRHMPPAKTLDCVYCGHPAKYRTMGGPAGAKVPFYACLCKTFKTCADCPICCDFLSGLGGDAANVCACPFRTTCSCGKGSKKEGKWVNRVCVAEDGSSPACEYVPVPASSTTDTHHPSRTGSARVTARPKKCSLRASRTYGGFSSCAHATSKARHATCALLASVHQQAFKRLSGVVLMALSIQRPWTFFHPMRT